MTGVTSLQSQRSSGTWAETPPSRTTTNGRTTTTINSDRHNPLSPCPNGQYPTHQHAQCGLYPDTPPESLPIPVGPILLLTNRNGTGYHIAQGPHHLITLSLIPSPAPFQPLATTAASQPSRSGRTLGFPSMLSMFSRRT
jgi:hypothetical protein